MIDEGYLDFLWEREDEQWADRTDAQMVDSIRHLERAMEQSSIFTSEGQTSTRMQLGEMRRVLARRKERANA